MHAGVRYATGAIAAVLLLLQTHRAAMQWRLGWTQASSILPCVRVPSWLSDKWNALRFLVALLVVIASVSSLSGCSPLYDSYTVHIMFVSWQSQAKKHSLVFEKQF